MNRCEQLLCGLLLWVSWQSPACGDLVHLSSGRTLEGIVVWETPSRVKLQVSWRGYVTIERDAVGEIVRGDDQEHERLFTEWREAFLAAGERRRQRAAFEAQQRARGLVRHQGTWISLEELKFIEEKSADARRKYEEQLQRLTERLRALEAQNRILSQRLARRPVVLRSSRFFLPHHGLPHARLAKDEQGNLLRLR